MLTQLFLSLALMGANWVLYALILMSVISVAIMIERSIFYGRATHGLNGFRSEIRNLISQGKLDVALQRARDRRVSQQGVNDLETHLTEVMLAKKVSSQKVSPEILNELAQDAVLRARISWDRALSLLATLGSNAPFVGLFGTVLGIIQAFHELGQNSVTGVSGVTSGISEALVATAVGLIVAIPAILAYNKFQRQVRIAIQEAEALKSFLVGSIAE